MTLAEFRTEALLLCDQQGQNAYEATVDQTRIANEVLRDFSRATRCFFSDKIPFTPVAGTSTYKFDAPISAFGNKALVDIVRVSLTQDGNFASLKNLDGDYGPVLLSQLQVAYPQYQTEPNGSVKHFYINSPASLILWPAPAVVTGTHYITGYTYHPVLSADGDVLEVPSEDLRGLIQMFAYLLLVPNSSGESSQRAVDYMNLARAEWEKRGLATMKQMSPNAIRTSYSGGTFSLING